MKRSKPIKLIDGHKYKIQESGICFELYLEYHGDCCQGDSCSLCDKELNKGYSFADTLDKNPHTRIVYGSECVRKVVVEDISNN